MYVASELWYSCEPNPWSHFFKLQTEVVLVAFFVVDSPGFIRVLTLCLSMGMRSSICCVLVSFTKPWRILFTSRVVLVGWYHRKTPIPLPRPPVMRSRALQTLTRNLPRLPKGWTLWQPRIQCVPNHWLALFPSRRFWWRCCCSLFSRQKMRRRLIPGWDFEFPSIPDSKTNTPRWSKRFQCRYRPPTVLPRRRRQRPFPRVARWTKSR